MLSCIFDDDPCLFIENMPAYWNPGELPVPGAAHPARQGATWCAPAATSRVISYSRMLQDCAAVADKLAEEGISVEVIDLRTISPLDEATLLARWPRPARRGRARGGAQFGVGAEIAALLHEQLFGELKAPVQRVGAHAFAGAVLQAAGDGLHPAAIDASKRPCARRSAERLAFVRQGIPVATQVLLPKIGFSMNEATLAEWMVADGAAVTEGQPLYAIESDKSTQEIESPASGTLKIIAAGGRGLRGRRRAGGNRDERSSTLPAWPEIDFAAFGEVEVKPLSRFQGLAAGFLSRNWQTIPHVTHQDDADITALDALRQTLEPRAERAGLLREGAGLGAASLPAVQRLARRLRQQASC